MAIEYAFLGLDVTVIEKRGFFARNNSLHIWPSSIEDLKYVSPVYLFIVLYLQFEQKHWGQILLSQVLCRIDQPRVNQVPPVCITKSGTCSWGHLPLPRGVF